MSERVRHIKHGTTYRVLGEASFHNASRRLTGEGDAITIYQSEEDGSLWARPSNEFRDGRFERIPSPSPSSAEATGGVADAYDVASSVAVAVAGLPSIRALAADEAEHQDIYGQIQMAALPVLQAAFAAPEPAAPVQPAPDGWRDADTIALDAAREIEAIFARNWTAEPYAPTRRLAAVQCAVLDAMNPTRIRSAIEPAEEGE